MQISNDFYSHPGKCYNEHIERIALSFEDDEHKVVATFHDLGKLSKKFQTYITLKQNEDENSEAFEKRRSKYKTTHTLESAYLYFCNTEVKDNHFLANFFAILYHHTNFNDLDEAIRSHISVVSIDDERMKQIEEVSQRSSLLFNSDHFMFKFYFKKQIDKSVYSSEDFFLFKERYSRLILADKYEAIFSEPYQNLDYLEQEHIDQYLTNIQSIINKKQQKCSNDYRTNVRTVIFNSFESKSLSNVYLIKAPTGVGKTFLALELALKIAKEQKQKRRIITAIPFTSIIDQTHTEYENVFNEESVLKYHHLTKYSEEDDEKEQFSQKVFLKDIWHEHFIVTTFNQLLNTFLSNHNRDNLRLETLRDSVVIIDEVQNISRTLLPGIVKILDEFSKRYNIHFIIMSATMPSFEGLLPNAQILSEDWFYDKKKSRYRLYYDDDITNFDCLAKRMKQYEKQSVLCVVNTIEKAKKLYEYFTCNVYLLTTHQTPKHRKEIIEVIKCRLKHNEPITLIATQLIEAGIDLDFDVGYREFAPFGSIIQMAGRVNREGTKKTSDVIVFDFLALENQNDDLKKLPYHYIDLQEEEIKSWLKPTLLEEEILANLDTYFETVYDQSRLVDLESSIHNLEFQTLFKSFNDNFMPKQPWKVSLFIEEKADHFKTFLKKREEIFKTNNKFDAIPLIKELEKDLGNNTISVNHKLLKELHHNIAEDSFMGRYVLPFDSAHYTKEEGFKPYLTRIEEAFS